MYAKRVYYTINEAHTTDSNQYTPSISEITRTAHDAYYTPAEVFFATLDLIPRHKNIR
jgi:hypothetical protein